jgi:predicted permease
MFAEELRYAFRALRAHRLFSAAVTLIMALAIGANTAVFALLNAVLLSRLPFRDPSRLVTVQQTRPDSQVGPFSLPDFLDVQDGTRAFETLAAAFQWSANLTGGEAERLQGMRVSASFFPMLGTSAWLGRTLVADDERGAGRRVVVLTHGFWVRRFGADPAAIGTTLTLNGETYTIVGVLPAAFVTPVRDADLIAPFPTATDPRRTARDACFLRVVGRLKAGVSIRQAETDLNGIMTRLSVECPTTNATHAGARVVGWHRALVAGERPLLLLLQAAVALVLLVACANLANLFLTFALRREREFAIHAALGASRSRLVGEVVLEAALLASVGGGGGIIVGHFARRALLVFAPVDLLAVFGGARLDWRVLTFAVAASAFAALACGAVPAWRLSTATPGARSMDSRSGGPAAGRAARRALVGIEVALASALVTLTVLLSQSFARLQAVDPGFRADHLLTVRLSLPHARYPHRDSIARFVDGLRPRLLAVPGVVDAAAVNVVPLNNYRATADVWPAARPQPPPEERSEAHYRMVSASYLKTFGVTLLAGRAFDDHDAATSEAVVLVNDRLARRFWPDQSAVNRSLMLDDGDGTIRRARIVGVTGDVKHFGLEAESTPDVYVPIAQVPEATIGWLANNMYWGLQTSANPDGVREAVRRAVRSVDPDVPASAMRSMNEVLALAVAPRRLNLWLVRVFALAAILLAAAGVYAVTAFTVALRTREIGIRTALGARVAQNQRLILGDAAGPIIGGLAGGVALSFVAAPFLRTVLFGVDPVSPGALAVVAALLLSAGLAAAFVAAWRLRAIDPVVALRAE